MRRAFLAAWLVPLLASASGLDRVRQKGELAWGLDAEGGAPYAFEDPDAPDHLIGFEFELAQAIADKLGVKLKPVQVTWERLPELVLRGDVDFALNGLEETDDKRATLLLTRPYYAGPERLAVRRDVPWRPNALAGLTGHAIGTLPGSLAERLLQRAGAIPKTYDGGQGEIYEDLRIGRTEGVLLDEPAARYYGSILPELDVLPESFGEVRYAALLRPGDDELRQAIDDALEQLAKSGALKAIYERWAVWTPETAGLFGLGANPSGARATAWERWLASATHAPTLRERLFDRYPKLMPAFARAAAITLGVSISAMLLAIALGVLLALGRAYGPRIVVRLATLYVELVRGTPLLVQLTMIYFGLPELGLTLPPFFAGVLALGLNYAAAEAENYRAGLASVPAGQLEAARALGLTKWQAIRHVIAPQAIRTALPPVTNDFIALLKDSSLVSLVTLTELTRAYAGLANATRDHLGLGIMVAAWYLVIGLPFAYLARRAEAGMSRHLRRAA